ncbi:MAG: hypothetical protein DLM53_09665 [Candidatus Eremiobacter antarcticus]|nr:hypothetical protein [Candidatus Eremiobacteraeota bacterium]PZR61479.1 MAG: hypothetical protein DLM53_09665 [Candidatus Eremiobacter sp. RRmetagenome_bin22]
MFFGALMSPEYLTAIASIGTFIVIAVTALAAIVQLRHIRASNQLTGVMQYTKLFESEQIQKANKFIQEELASKLRDAQYRRELFTRNPDRRQHVELAVADWCEQAGSYIKYGLIEKDQFLDLSGAYVASMWQALKEVVAIRRVAAGQEMYVNFEYLAALERKVVKGPDAFYPKGVQRLLSEAESHALAGVADTTQDMGLRP